MTVPITNTILDQSTKSIGAVVDKLLGPTAEVMGQELVDLYTRRRNITKVARRAAERSNLDVDGTIPARVAAEVFDKAQWAEDEFVAEYLSGVLASARTPDGRNDSGVSWTALVGRLSSDQLALHWLLYTSFQRRHRGSDPATFWPTTQIQIVADYPSLFSTLSWPLAGGEDTQRLMDAAYGLKREGLLTDLTHGGGDYLQDEVTWTKGHRFNRAVGYLTFKVTSDGVGLLLHAVGQGKIWFGNSTASSVSSAIDESSGLPLGTGSVLIGDLPVA